MNVDYIKFVMYYSDMKKVLLMIILAGLTAQTVLAAGSSDAKKAAYKKMMQSHKLQHETCLNVVDNFRFDHQFGNYMKYRCQLFESDRQRLLNSVFTITSTNNAEGAVENYMIPKASFVVKLNNDEINTYKKIVQEYCKYNSYKFAKKDPQACSPARVNSLFQTMP